MVKVEPMRFSPVVKLYTYTVLELWESYQSVKNIKESNIPVSITNNSKSIVKIIHYTLMQ